LLHHARCPVIVVSPRASERVTHDEQAHAPTHGVVDQDLGRDDAGDRASGGPAGQGGAR
jgi:hypothetical protein